MRSCFIAKRLKGSTPPLGRVLPNIARLLSQWQSVSPLSYAGSPPVPIELNEAGISQYLQNKANAIGFPQGFVLSSGDRRSDLKLSIYTDDFSQIESIEFPLPYASQENFLHVDIFSELVGQICTQFNAYHGYVRDDSIARLHGQARRYFDRQFDRVPPDLNQTIPPTPRLGDREILPYLMLESEFDNRRVPNGIWWVNFWDGTQVQTVGKERVKTAPWTAQKEFNDGAMVLVATASPTDVRDRAHLAKLEAIARYLQLSRIQQQYSLSN